MSTKKAIDLPYYKSQPLQGQVMLLAVPVVLIQPFGNYINRGRGKVGPSARSVDQARLAAVATLKSNGHFLLFRIMLYRRIVRNQLSGLKKLKQCFLSMQSLPAVICFHAIRIIVSVGPLSVTPWMEHWLRRGSACRMPAGNCLRFTTGILLHRFRPRSHYSHSRAGIPSSFSDV
jgi:hypothetical protein